MKIAGIASYNFANLNYAKKSDIKENYQQKALSNPCDSVYFTSRKVESDFEKERKQKKREIKTKDRQRKIAKIPDSVLRRDEHVEIESCYPNGIEKNINIYKNGRIVEKITKTEDGKIAERKIFKYRKNETKPVEIKRAKSKRNNRIHYENVNKDEIQINEKYENEKITFPQTKIEPTQEKETKGEVLQNEILINEVSKDEISQNEITENKNQTNKSYKMNSDGTLRNRRNILNDGTEITTYYKPTGEVDTKKIYSKDKNGKIGQFTFFYDNDEQIHAILGNFKNYKKSYFKILPTDTNFKFELSDGVFSLKQIEDNYTVKSKGDRKFKYKYFYDKDTKNLAIETIFDRVKRTLGIILYDENENFMSQTIIFTYAPFENLSGVRVPNLNKIFAYYNSK